MKKVLFNHKRPAITKTPKKEFKKLLKQNSNKIFSTKPNKLEKTPPKDHFDFSMEEEGIFILRDDRGKILRIVDMIFPR